MLDVFNNCLLKYPVRLFFATYFVLYNVLFMILLVHYVLSAFDLAGADKSSMSTTPKEPFLREWLREEMRRQLQCDPSEAMLDSALEQMAAQDERWATTPQLNREAVQDYWRSASSMGNRPEDYLRAPTERSQFLLELLRLAGLLDPSILEIGCNAGRNLAWLQQAGFTRLAGIEISPAAMRLLRETYPELAVSAMLYESALEDAVLGFADRQFDVVFSMAVLVHIHSDSDWVFPEIARITGDCLITIEDELNETPRHFLRQYQTVFEAHGLTQVLKRDCSHIDGLGPYTARMFRRF
jgi:SAM-dependent methyltransferase